MTQAASDYQAAWGLELSQSAARLVRIVSDDQAAPRITQENVYSADNVLGGGKLDPLLLNALSKIPPSEPLGICFPDRLMMCRGFSLPQSSAELTEKMVHAQAAAMFLDGADRLQLAWTAAGDPFDSSMQWIILCSTQRKWLSDLIQSLPAHIAVLAVLPRGLLAPMPNNDSNSLLVGVGVDSITFLFIAKTQLLRAIVLEWDEAPGTGEWHRKVRQTFSTLVQGFSRDRWPTTVSIRVAEGIVAEALRSSFEAALQLPCISLPEINAAVAAAVNALAAPSLTSINFVATRSPATVVAAFPKRAVTRAAAACLLGLVSWYGIDCLRDWSLTRKFQQLRDVESSSGSVERRLAVGTYLEKNVSPALIIFDAILSSAPSSLSMTSFGVNPAGQCHLTGMVGSASELDDFMRKLQASPVTTNVQLRSAKVEQNRWQIDMTADAKPMSGLMPAAPSPTAPSAGQPAIAGQT